MRDYILVNHLDFLYVARWSVIGDIISVKGKPGETGFIGTSGIGFQVRDIPGYSTNFHKVAWKKPI